MDVSPFPHQGPLEPSQVRGRDELVADLVERVTARRVTALLGPRRFGKTSVLGKAAAVVSDAGVSVVWIDLYETQSAADLVVRIDDALASASGPARDRVGKLAATASINLGMFKLELARPPSRRPDVDASLHVVLDLLVGAARAVPTLIVIDEFTGLGGVKGAAGLLRTKLQHHVQEIGLLFAGSEPTAMNVMFTNSGQPFYAQADLVEIAPFTPAELTDIVDEGFASTGRRSSNVASQIHQVTGGHPYRAMQLADAAWSRTQPAQTAIEVWPEALQAVRLGLGPGFETLFSSFSSSEQAVLRALASGRPLFGSSLELFGSSSGAVTAARERLVSDGTITRAEQIVDPLLADWIAHRFPL